MWQRARTDEQRQTRVHSVLSAAAALFDRLPYEEVSLGKIAAEAGFTRSNLYRYFSSREEIFLELYRMDLDAWLSEFTAELDAESAERDAGASLSAAERLTSFVALWTQVLLRQQRLMRLTPLLSISLERNSSEEQYRAFKEFTADLMQRAAAIIRRRLPALSDSTLYRFFLVHQALVAGAAPMCRYNEMQRRVLESPSLAHLRVDFEGLYSSVMLAYLRGAEADE